MTIIDQGQLRDGRAYQVRRLDPKDLPILLSLQETVYDSLENKAQLAPLEPEAFSNILEGNGFILGVFAQGDLVAIRALLVPEVDEAEHLGLDVGLTEEELGEVIYQEISFVHPDYQGNRLQQTLARLIMAELEGEDHPYRYVCATVAPYNIPSLLDKFRQGLLAMALKYKYDRQLRFVFLKDLAAPLSEEDFTHFQDIPVDQIEEQQALLAQGWVGLSLEKQGHVYRVTYGKK